MGIQRAVFQSMRNTEWREKTTVLFQKTIPLLVLLTVISMFTYGHFLLARPVDYYGLFCVNFDVYLCYCFVLEKEMSGAGKKWEDESGRISA